MSRLFIDIHLRQWAEGQSVTLRDLDGNEITLDGLIHTQPHQFILVELDPNTNSPIAIPGRFTDYHPSNAHPISADNPRVPHPQPKVKRTSEGVVAIDTGEPIAPAGAAIAGAPLGVPNGRA